MKTETIDYIKRKLQNEEKDAREVLLQTIAISTDDGITPNVEDKIKKYRRICKIREDFEKWAEETKSE